MARVTVEDCLHSVENRFELVLLATKRARQIANGAEAKVEPGYDKPAVIALREIAQHAITANYIDEVENQEKVLAAQQALEWATAQTHLEEDDATIKPTPTESTD